LVDSVERCNDGIHRSKHCPALGRAKSWKALVPEDAPVQKLHYVKGAANDCIVFAQRVYAGNRYRCMCQRAHDPVFPVDRVGARQQMAKGLAPQNIRSGGGGEFVSRVGLAALEPLGRERATEPGDAIAHPPFEPTEGQIIRGLLPLSMNPPVTDTHLVPHKPALPTVDCIWAPGNPLPR
jgi:hypothetical protein